MKTFHVRFHKRDHTSGLRVVQAIDSNSAKKQFWDGATIISRIYEVKPDAKKAAE
jgi:hypothetical protein